MTTTDSSPTHSSTSTRVALVTGGSRGIGAAIARALADAGADVAITYVGRAQAAADVVDDIVASGRRAIAIQVDSADGAAVEAAIEHTVAELGRLDVLVNNAAEFAIGSLDAFDATAFDRMVAANVRGPFLAARAAARHMTAGGRIISIGSNMVDRTVFPGLTLYSLSKTALVGMTKGLSRDLGPQGITVNLVNPGATDTEMNPADSDMAPAIRAFTALDRYATPDEVAAAVAFLAGEGGRYVTGAQVNVDGGFTV